MKLGFDLDEVLANISDVIIKYLQNTYGIQGDKEMFKRFNIIDNTFHSDSEFDRNIVADLLEKVNKASFLAKAKPYKEAAENIKQFKKSGHSIHFITSRKLNDEVEVAKWLRKYNIPFDTIHNVGKEREKGFYGRALNLDFYIDDLVEQLESMFRYKKRWRKGLALLTRPWNEGPIDASKFIRLDNWVQISRHLGIHNR
jgi:uncharacterized HAD superfamily protein